jgi:hypothetical protein
MPTLLTPIGTREGGIRCNYSKGFIDREEDWHFRVDSGRNNDGSPINVDRSTVLFNTPGLPIIGVTIMGGMLCIGGDATRKDELASVWDVTLTFSTNVDEDDASNGQQQGDPTTWIPVRRTMWEVKEEVSETDASNNPCVNTADQPFSTKMVRRRRLPAWEFTQFEPLSVTDDDIIARAEVMNSGVYKTKPAKTWLCTVQDSTVGFYMGFRCRMTVYRLVYDFKKWTEKRLSIGYLYKDGSNRFPYVVRGQVIEGPLTSAGNRVIDENGATISGRTLATVELDSVPAVSFSFLRI